MKLIKRGGAGSASGIGLLDALIGGVISVIVIGSAIAVFISGQSTFSRETIESSLRTESATTLDAMAAMLQDCGASTASLAAADANGGPYLTLQQCCGASGSSAIWGPPLKFGYEKGAVPAGQSLGNICNGKVILTKGGAKQAIGSNLPAGGLAIQLSGSMVTLQLTLQRPIPAHAPVVVTATRTVCLKN
ncbi:MAG: hypothetical protein HY286_08395 [Planctomycetes bacterium]|nr:hypothetical protein [Planctomycetota bacterium]